MGELIRFRPRQGARPEPTGTAQAGTSGQEGTEILAGAEILLFLGVRYERHDDKVAGSTKRPVRRGSRAKRA